jgi:hypothetical protein
LQRGFGLDEHASEAFREALGGEQWEECEEGEHGRNLARKDLSQW